MDCNVTLLSGLAAVESILQNTCNIVGAILPNATSEVAMEKNGRQQYARKQIVLPSKTVDQKV